ncbi:metal ABC transporter ATP-binding protein [Fervidicella metallireducens AeB]|uniref:Metal ABC transporter ATP-binding protein n=1 Tax=Fervidicella metallireducens AeB TaxID=1403537 RepID=A0A017RTQ8_9CLOT|nr:metal ABC transporter ATP-binding protein [Fervidicella metallireducens]EYE87290.1 metal ABC transporter ATP-binding protein [Fervidicella metallireducens AeB]
MINIKNLSFSYNKIPPYILENINLEIKKGDYVSILGDNGSGKSTLIKLLLKLLKPCSGTIQINTQKIGYVPQRFEGFNSQFPVTIYEMLNCHRKALKIKDSSIVLNSLLKVDMLNYKNSLIGNLSGGQQQKIFIARAMMGNPELLILDEPSTGIDVQSQYEIYSLIKSLNTNLGITVVAIEHNLNAALVNSDYIFKLKNGKGQILSINDYKENFQEVMGYASI